MLDLATRTFQKLGGNAAPSSLMFANFSPDGARVAYVHGNNLYVRELRRMRIQALTTNGSATLINGTSDWVNEEELNIRDAFRGSPDGQSVAFWQFDTTGVRQLHLLNNTEANYPRIISFPYPKVGETNSATRLGVVSVRGGKVRASVKSLRVEGADEVVLLLLAATNFKSYKDVSGNCASRVERYPSQLEGREFERIKQDHLKNHQALFNRVRLDLPVGKNSFLPTDVRLAKAKEEPDRALAALAFQFSRNLMMGSSRPGTQAANLQGIWNDDANAKWDAKYTVNINLQMNY